jgi:hypothetical protein
MNWLKRTVIKWASKYTMDGKVPYEDGPRVKSAVDDITSSDTIRFTLTPAVGGRILRVTKEGNYQKNTLGPSDMQTQLYVIPSGEDVGERVSKIVNLELFK